MNWIDSPWVFRTLYFPPMNRLIPSNTNLIIVSMAMYGLLVAFTAFQQIDANIHFYLTSIVGFGVDGISFVYLEYKKMYIIKAPNIKNNKISNNFQ